MVEHKDDKLYEQRAPPLPPSGSIDNFQNFLDPNTGNGDPGMANLTLTPAEFVNRANADANFVNMAIANTANRTNAEFANLPNFVDNPDAARDFGNQTTADLGNMHDTLLANMANVVNMDAAYINLANATTGNTTAPPGDFVNVGNGLMFNPSTPTDAFVDSGNGDMVTPSTTTASYIDLGTGNVVTHQASHVEPRLDWNAMFTGPPPAELNPAPRVRTQPTFTNDDGVVVTTTGEIPSVNPIYTSWPRIYHHTNWHYEYDTGMFPQDAYPEPEPEYPLRSRTSTTDLFSDNIQDDGYGGSPHFDIGFTADARPGHPNDPVMGGALPHLNTEHPPTDDMLAYEYQPHSMPNAEHQATNSHQHMLDVAGNHPHTLDAALAQPGRQDGSQPRSGNVAPGTSSDDSQGQNDRQNDFHARMVMLSSGEENLTDALTKSTPQMDVLSSQMSSQNLSIKRENPSQHDDEDFEIGGPVGAGPAEESEYEGTDEEDEIPSKRLKKCKKTAVPRKARQPREKLLKWTDSDWRNVVLAFVWACGEIGQKIPFAQAAQLISPRCTASALQQAILKLRQRQISEGHQIPTLKMTWPQKRKHSDSNSESAEASAPVTRTTLRKKKPTRFASEQSRVITLKRAFIEDHRQHLSFPYKGPSTGTTSFDGLPGPNAVDQADLTVGMARLPSFFRLRRCNDTGSTNGQQNGENNTAAANGNGNGNGAGNAVLRTVPVFQTRPSGGTNQAVPHTGHVVPSHADGFGLRRPDPAMFGAIEGSINNDPTDMRGHRTQEERQMHRDHARRRLEGLEDESTPNPPRPVDSIDVTSTLAGNTRFADLGHHPTINNRPMLSRNGHEHRRAQLSPNGPVNFPGQEPNTYNAPIPFVDMETFGNAFRHGQNMTGQQANNTGGPDFSLSVPNEAGAQLPTNDANRQLRNGARRVRHRPVQPPSGPGGVARRPPRHDFSTGSPVARRVVSPPDGEDPFDDSNQLENPFDDSNPNAMDGLVTSGAAHSGNNNSGPSSFDNVENQPIYNAHFNQSHESMTGVVGAAPPMPTPSAAGNSPRTPPNSNRAEQIVEDSLAASVHNPQGARAWEYHAFMNDIEGLDNEFVEEHESRWLSNEEVARRKARQREERERRQRLALLARGEHVEE